MAEDVAFLEERTSIEDEEGGPGTGPEGEEAEEEIEITEEEPIDIVDEEPIDEEPEDFTPVSENPETETAQLTGQEIVTDTFGELFLPFDQREHLIAAWGALLKNCGSRDAVADLLYTTYYNASPSLESLFVTPKAVLAFRLYMGVNNFFSNTRDSAKLRALVETQAYQHMVLEIDIPRVHIIRDAVVDMLLVELGSKLTSEAATACVSLYNYIGGAMIFIKANYQDRMTTLSESWRLANDEKKNAERMASASMEQAEGSERGQQEQESLMGDKKKSHQQAQNAQNIPTTFNEMFLFNAAVMGYGQNLWMSEVLQLLDNIVSNFHTVGRVQEECYVLTVRIAKVVTGKVNLTEFKSCLLASLRSLLPKEWTPTHEIAWSWLWDRVEQLLLENMGRTNRWEKAVTDLFSQVDEATGYTLRQEMYSKFFAASPEGESFFKQNMTYLHLLITKVLGLCINMYRDPVRNVDDISSIGLRHVGYGVPTELFATYVTTIVDCVKDIGADQISLQAFSWSMNLVAQMMARTIMEGSTIVMKAININSPTAVKAAIACAARGVRAEWMLLITVGTRDISPFLWSVQSGAHQASLAMLEDLLTIRADRDKYYYEAEYLFRRHDDLVNIFLSDAPTLIVPLLDGLIWRSRLTTNGYRRTNYYLKHLMLNSEGKFHKTLEWIVKSDDPKLMVHPMLVLLSDVIWSRVALRSFIQRKVWFVVTLVLFVLSQSIIKGQNAETDSDELRYLTFALRCCIYLCSMSQMLFTHVGKIGIAYQFGRTVPLVWRLRAPAYLTNWQDLCNFLLMLVLVVMLCTEPIMYCIDGDGRLFDEICPGTEDLRRAYYVLNMFAMFLYYILLLDLAVFSNGVSAYVLVCGRMLSEIALFIFAAFACLLTLSSAFSCLEQADENFQTIPKGFMAMWEMLLGMFDSAHYDALHSEPVILVGLYVYLVLVVVFLLNLLIAQLTCSYDAIYADMVGYARLKRSRIIVETMPMVSAARFLTFKESLNLDVPIEFNEGDVGIAGGMQVEEPASAHPTTVDSIKRFGGTTSPLVQWPQHDESGIGEDDRFGKMEVMIKKAADFLQARKGRRNKRSKTGGSSSGMGGQAAGSAGSGCGSEEGSASDH
eukprot:TRINITY_DN836_c0_g1_i1.p1 TRINITY_DN836_c0_g1~~TRINITY_DN836_c0_g1_i1.p1  ORF type:complete len:1114 (-),score=302.79 TRINITY_DN836_c0_g1_i1:58-3399(-)